MEIQTGVYQVLRLTIAKFGFKIFCQNYYVNNYLSITLLCSFYDVICQRGILKLKLRKLYFF